MPHDFPPHIAQKIEQYLPSEYEFFWIRGVLFDWSQTQLEVGYHNDFNNPNVTKSLENRPFVLARVVDVDSSPDKIITYELLMPGTEREYKFDPNDAVSLFGHRLKGDNAAIPRYMVNHNTYIRHTVYKDLMPDGKGSFFTPAADLGMRDKWMKIKAGLPKSSQRSAFWLRFIPLWLFVLSVGLVVVGAIATFLEMPGEVSSPPRISAATATMELVWGIIALWVSIVIARQGARKAKRKIDLTQTYEMISNDLYPVIADYQLPERKFVVCRREI